MVAGRRGNSSTRRTGYEHPERPADASSLGPALIQENTTPRVVIVTVSPTGSDGAQPVMRSGSAR